MDAETKPPADPGTTTSVTAAAAYKQVQDGLRRRLASGVWPVGAMLPGRRDLAREYGVSTFTVERAINGLVSDGLLRTDDRRGTFVARIPAASAIAHASAANSAAELAAAAADPFPLRSAAPVRPLSPLAPPKTGPVTIGIVASLYPAREDHLALNNMWVRMLVESIEHAFAEEGEMTRFFNRVIGSDDGAPLRSMRDAIADASSSADVDALVVIGIGSEPQEIESGLAALRGIGLPIICMTSGELQRPFPHVFADDRGGGYQAAQHLLQQGCRDRLLYLAPFSALWTQERLAGIRMAAAHAGLPDDRVTAFPEWAPAWVNEKDPEVLGYDAGKAAFERGLVTRGIGVVCANDGVAFGFLHAAAEAGRVAGQDFLLIGFDDHPDARARNLTTLRKPVQAMGQEAARLLRQSLERHVDSLQIRLRWRLIPRASTQSLAGAAAEPAPEDSRESVHGMSSVSQRARPGAAKRLQTI